MRPDRYDLFVSRIAQTIPPERIIRDELRTLAFGTDASFYRLIPRVVVLTGSEQDVRMVLEAAALFGLPLTFRAAGTSLSGQAISDSILVMLGPSWNAMEILEKGSRVRLLPGVVGGHANARLLSYGRKIGPDPASINAAMIGGIAANNASGMCCGTAQNTYRTLSSMRIILADGTLVDTGDPSSRRAFGATHGDLLRTLGDLSRRIRENAPLAERIRRKYAMKNTTGYGLNALVDFDDPLEILQHLMIGSEGTLGFISEITLHTVPEHPHKASALILFAGIAGACTAVSLLKAAPVDAVELMDRASLRSVEEKPGMPADLRGLGDDVAALLVETRAATPERLREQIETISASLERIPTVRPIAFTDVPAEFALLWNIRKGLFPSVGAMRKLGTTVIIEDVAFPVPRLAEATGELRGLFRRHGYEDAIIFGHALEGNLHFVFTQDFNHPGEVERYRHLISDVTAMVVGTYDGALKAEHGTGRNMAPFVPLEWGAEAYALMREIKHLFDPTGILNPGVIINDDPEAHLKSLKPLPPAHPIVDACIECGFCEVHCPSKNLTLTPRQRIVVVREMERLRSSGSGIARLETLASAFDREGNATCATDGLCATSCPVGIDTGKYIKDLRHRRISPGADAVAWFIAGHMAWVTAGARVALSLVHWCHRILGTRLMGGIAHGLRWISGKRIPLWNPYMPSGGVRIPRPQVHDAARPAVVYFPTCINRSMGPADGEKADMPLTTLVVRLLEKGGYRVIIPEGVDELCCGMAFASKGFVEQGERKARELESALLRASDNGRIPVLTDMSPCLYRMREVFTSGLRLYEPVRFALDHLRERVEFVRTPGTVALHTTCSAEKMGLAGPLRELAELCVEHVVVPEEVECCGWAGDRGFTVPELNASALRDLRRGLPRECAEGYSTSRTCEIGLSLHSGIHYQSILYLVDRCTRPKN
jgi:D-lactate dehydrogenase